MHEIQININNKTYNLIMFFARQKNSAKIFPVTEAETESESDTDDGFSYAEAGTDEYDIEKEIHIETDYDTDYIYNNRIMCYIDEDLSKLVLYTIMDQLLQKNAFCNEFGVIDISNIDEFEIDLFEILRKDGLDLDFEKVEYGFKVSPKDCMMANGSMYDGIISNHCDHSVEHWLPLEVDTRNAKLDWYIFVNSSFCIT